MRACKNYHDLTQMYHFNPIDNSELFENMETQHFYNPNTNLKEKEGMCKYIYWYNDDEIRKKNDRKHVYNERMFLNLGEGKYLVLDNVENISKEHVMNYTDMRSIILPSTLTKD